MHIDTLHCCLQWKEEGITTSYSQNPTRRSSRKLYGDGPRPLSFDVVEVRKNSGGDHPPETLPLFPWDFKVELPLNQIGGYGPIELSSEQAFDYVLKHWDEGTVSRMISHGQEQIPIVVQDLESGFKHDIYLVRSTEGGGEEKYKIHLHWKQKNVRKQELAGRLHEYSRPVHFHGFFVRKASLLPSSASRVRYSINDRRWLNLDLASTSYRFRNLNSSESLSLLAETTYVDSVLTALPVLSEEEQNALAATPAHPVGLYALYASSLAGNLVEQLWNFAWPSSIALLHPSLLPVAVMGFFTCHNHRRPFTWQTHGLFLPEYPAYMGLNVVQAAAQLLSATMIIHAHTVSSTSAPAVLFRPWFIVLVLAGAIERLCGVATGVAVERDWVILLAGMNRPIALAQANAVLNRIDLLCEIAGASVFGFLLSKYEPVTCLKYAAASMIWSLPVMIGLTWLTNKLATGVLDRPKSCQTSCGESPEEAVVEAGSIVDRGLETIKLGWKEYMQQPVLPASLAYVLLFFNVVLAPSSLMTAFLTQHGVNPSIIGGLQWIMCFHGCCSNISISHLGQATRHFEGWSSWTCISGFSSLPGCCCVLEWISFSAEPCTSLPGIDCIIKTGTHIPTNEQTNIFSLLVCSHLSYRMQRPFELNRS
ncbi:hypothetical protein OIU76_003146 [Salix suchowensis]|nr:hypothetical protein OIU76_003146 [Salix suchowensis]